MDPSAAALYRPSTSPRPLTPVTPRLADLKENMSFEARVEQLLQNWMEHFDRRFQELASIQARHAFPSYTSFTPDQSRAYSSHVQDQYRVYGSWAPDHPEVFREYEGASMRPARESAELRFCSMFGDQSQPAEAAEAIGSQIAEAAKARDTLNPYKNALQSSTALQARTTVRERMLDLQKAVAHSKSGIPKTGIGCILNHPQFESIISLAIVINGILIGVQVELTARSGPSDHAVFEVAEIIFFVIFVCELFLRIYGLRSKWVKSFWNIFDAVLVAIQLFELVLKLTGGNIASKGSATGRLLRVSRLVRIVRVLRLLRFFVQLRVMVKMIMFSLDSLFWLMILLVVMMYIVAIMLTQGYTDYANSDSVTVDQAASLERKFGDIPTSTWTLFQSITNGIGWGPVAEDLLEAHVFLYITFVVFMFFVFFSVLNVVTGVFVDGAIQHGGQEREVLVASERSFLEGTCIQLMELLLDIDEDNSGTISLEELMKCSQDPNLSSYFSALQIHTPETAELFAFLDRDGSGEIDIREFVDGCLRIRGGARNIDLHLLMYRMEGEQVLLRQSVQGTFGEIQKIVARIHHHVSQVQTAMFTIPATSEHSAAMWPSYPPKKVSRVQPAYEPQTPRESEPHVDIPSDVHMGKCIPHSPRSHITKLRK